MCAFVQLICLLWIGYLTYDSVALGRLPYKVTEDPMVTPLRELAYLPKGVTQPRNLPPKAQRAGLRPKEILEQIGNPDAD